MIDVVKTAITVAKGWYEGNMEVVTTSLSSPQPT